MNEEKLIGLQMQVRQNQQELMDYVKELDGWGEEMKQKEHQIKLETTSCIEVSVLFIARRYASAVYAVVVCLFLFGCVSFCLSQAGIVSKQLNVKYVASHDSGYRVNVQGLWLSDAKDLGEIRTGSPPTGARNADGVG